MSGRTFFAAVLVALSVAQPALAFEVTSRTLLVRTARGDGAYDLGLHGRWALGPAADIPGRPELFAEGGFDYWHAPGAAHHRSLVTVSATGGLRWRPTDPTFVDVSLGPHVLSRTRLEDRRFGIALQFGSRLAAGAAFGEAGNHELAAYVEHLSNASLARANSGMTFFGVEYRYTPK